MSTAAIPASGRAHPPFGVGLAQQYVALLEEDDTRLQTFALTKLLSAVDVAWAETSEQIATIESLAESPAFPSRELAAAVASKVSAAFAAIDRRTLRHPRNPHTHPSVDLLPPRGIRGCCALGTGGRALL